jgi:hypothetical protein
MVLAYAGHIKVIIFGWCSLIEGIPEMILQFKVLVVIPPAQTAPLGGLALGKLLSECLAVHPLISL